MMNAPEDPRRDKPSDPVGFVLLIVLLILSGGAILLAVNWIMDSISKAS